MKVIFAVLTLVFLTLALTVVPPHQITTAEHIKMELEFFANELENFKVHNSTYPSTEDGLQVLTVNVPEDKYPNHQSYLVEIPTDPWGNPYLYFKLSDDRFEIISLGPDRIKSEDDILFSELSNPIKNFLFRI